MRGLVRDLRSGWRILTRHPFFACAAVLTMGLGLGATATIWSVVEAVLLSALPYPHADRLVLVASTLRSGAAVEATPVSYRDYNDWRDGASSLEDLAVFSDATSFNLLAGDRSEHLGGELVSAGYLELLGVKAEAGRLITTEDDAPGAPLVAVVSHDLGRRKGGGAVGSTLRLNGLEFEVIGVAAPGFSGLSDRARLWLPINAAPRLLGPNHLRWRGYRWLSAVGRLRAGASLAAASQDLGGIAKDLAARFPRSNQDMGVRLTPLSTAWFGDLRRALAILLAGALAVLAIGCVNVAGLLLARGVVRRREVAVRSVMGADHRLLRRQLLAEGAVLALAGGGLGLLFARWGGTALVAASGFEVKSFVHVGIGPAVIAAMVALALLSTLAASLAPAWRMARIDFGAALKEGSRGSAGPGRGRFLAGLVVSEVALAVVLLVFAGLALRGFRALWRTDLGYRADGVLTARLDLVGERYQNDGTVRALARQLHERLGRLPGALRVALVGPGIPTDTWYGSDFLLEQRGDGGRADQPVVLYFHHATPGYFAALGVPLRRGRDFLPGDDERAAGVAIVSESVARRFWPGRDAIGRRLKIPETTDWMNVVAVAADVRHAGLGGEAREPIDVYLPLFQQVPHIAPTLNIVVRATSASSPGLAPMMRREIGRAAPDLALYDVATLAERLARQTARGRFLVSMLAIFSILALLLAAIGIYGVVAYAVGQERREIGIRMALGALRRDVVGRIARRGARLALLGVAVGGLAAFVLSRLLGGFLHGVSATDPLTLLGVGLMLFGVALAASTLPAWRVARIEPLEVLGSE